MVASDSVVANSTTIEEEYRDHIERGKSLYRNSVLPELKEAGQANKGSFVVIDVPSGLYEVDVDDSVADSRLRLRCPNAFTWKERIGYNAPHAVGGGLSLDDEFEN